jgi:hypothetical protein
VAAEGVEGVLTCWALSLRRRHLLRTYSPMPRFHHAAAASSVPCLGGSAAKRSRRPCTTQRAPMVEPENSLMMTQGDGFTGPLGF